jgi:multidrug resistance protein MdtO
LTAESSKINLNFDKLRDLADLYPFESFPKKPHESMVNRSIRTLLPELRAFLLVKTGLLQHRSLATEKMEEMLIRDVDETASSALHRLADAIEKESAEELSSWNAHTDEVREKVSIEGDKVKDEKYHQRYTEVRLCISLLGLASALERRARLNFMHDPGAEKVIGNWPVDSIAKAQGTPSPLS